MKSKKFKLRTVQTQASYRGIKIEKINGETVKFGGYRTGYLATDATGKQHRWANLSDFYLNVIELGREIDGFARA